MTRIDFYILDQYRPGNDLVFACRLADKAFQGGHNIYIHVISTANVKELDALLWTFRPGSFLPHTVVNSATAEENATPITISNENPSNDHNDVLINLSLQLPSDFKRFKRIAEIVNGEQNQKLAARDRYRSYREQGLPIQSHNVDA